MTIKDDLVDAVHDIAVGHWGNVPDATVIPAIESLTFGTSGARMDVTILYADISDSTKLVDAIADTIAAELYKSFLHCASQLVRHNGGVIQAYDGDRIMAVFSGATQADDAVETAMQLHDAVNTIINPKFQGIYRDIPELRFTVGIDSGRCLVIKVGVRATGELAWIGGAANYAAKLNSFEGLDHDYPIRVTRQTRRPPAFSSGTIWSPGLG
jgi:class 3 adenylate cyclase